jgi:hypothetical protein
MAGRVARSTGQILSANRQRCLRALAGKGAKTDQRDLELQPCVSFALARECPFALSFLWRIR